VRLSPLGTSAINWLYCTSRGWWTSMEQLVEWELAGETEVFGKNLPKCHFVHHKSYMTWHPTRAAAVWSRRLIAWAMTRPYCKYHSYFAGVRIWCGKQRANPIVLNMMEMHLLRCVYEKYGLYTLIHWIFTSSVRIRIYWMQVSRSLSLLLSVRP
jgi:hypothetical protein